MITPRGPIMVSRKMAMKNEPNIRLRWSRHCFACFLYENAEDLSGETLLHRISMVWYSFPGWWCLLNFLCGCPLLRLPFQQMRSSKKLLEMRGESWKFRCQQQCLARSGEESTRKLVALLMLARQNAHSSLKPTNLRESDWKELYIKFTRITLQERESFIEPPQSRAQV